MQGREKVQSCLFGTTPIGAVLPEELLLRKVRALFDEAWKNLAPAFDTAYGPAVLLRAHLLRALYIINSERAL